MYMWVYISGCLSGQWSLLRERQAGWLSISQAFSGLASSPSGTRAEKTCLGRQEMRHMWVGPCLLVWTRGCHTGGILSDDYPIVSNDPYWNYLYILR